MPDQFCAPKSLILHNHFPCLLQSLFYNFCNLYPSPVLVVFLLSLKSLLGRDLVYCFSFYLLALCCGFLPTPPLSEEPRLLKAGMSVGG